MIRGLIEIMMLTWLIKLIAAIAKALFKTVAFIATAPFKLIANQLQKLEDSEGKVKRVIDGDSIIVDTKQGIKEVRIKGIDAPEHGQEGFGRAKRAVEKMALGHEVILKDQEIDDYGRVAANVEFKHKNLNAAEELAAEGMAFPDPIHTTRKIKSKAREAKKEKKGVWNSNEPPPWDFREISGM